MAAIGASVLAAEAASQGIVRVKMQNLVFDPEVVEAKVGQMIEWINNDHYVHTATADGKWNYTIPVGKKISHRVKASDAGDYYCRLHPNMRGKIKIVS